MKYGSTRRSAPTVSIGEALLKGAAPDGGLYLPEAIPVSERWQREPDAPAAEFASRFLQPFFAGDALEHHLPAICADAFGFPAPLVAPLPQWATAHALELFHGPTGAFKDFGARFLMCCFDRIRGDGMPLTVLAATSGDTGAAVGCAAEGRASVQAVILFPQGRVSKFQERQLSCWKEPVRALEVQGDFDECQRLVKAAFADPKLASAFRLTSANSINLGRLLPQAAYIAQAALKSYSASGVDPGFIIPTGNLGHGLALLLARAMGVPIGPVIFATNANPTLKKWAASGRYEPRPSIVTLANAMDVGAPSNFERLMALPADQRDLRVELVDDDSIRSRIRTDYLASGYVWCPHSATAAEAYARLGEAERAERPWILAATAHPYKFREIVEPLIGRAIQPPPTLEAILDRPTRKTTIASSLGTLAGMLGSSTLASL